MGCVCAHQKSIVLVLEGSLSVWVCELAAMAIPIMKAREEELVLIFIEQKISDSN